MTELVEDAEQLLDQLEISSCLFVGLSIGGMIGQALASKRPDLISAMVLSNTAAKFGDASLWEDRITAIKAGGIKSLSEAILERWFAPNFHQQPEFEAWSNMLQRSPLEGYIGCCSAIAGTDLSQTTSDLSLPVLTIAGAEDGSSPPSLVRSLNDMISNACMITIENAGHLPCVEQPEAFAVHLNDFIRETKFV
jgi:3-oxoadipate enol-lactonase